MYYSFKKLLKMHNSAPPPFIYLYFHCTFNLIFSMHTVFILDSQCWWHCVGGVLANGWNVVKIENQVPPTT